MADNVSEDSGNIEEKSKDFSVLTRDSETSKADEDSSSSPHLWGGESGLPKMPNEIIRKYKAGVEYTAKFIGSELMTAAKGDSICHAALQKMKNAVLTAKQHKPKIRIRIQADAIRLCDLTTKVVLHMHNLAKISYIVSDPTDRRAFGYIYGDKNGPWTFYGIKTEGPAIAVILAMKELFESLATVISKKQAEEKLQEKTTDNAESKVNEDASGKDKIDKAFEPVPKAEEAKPIQRNRSADDLLLALDIGADATPIMGQEQPRAKSELTSPSDPTATAWPQAAIENDKNVLEDIFNGLSVGLNVTPRNSGSGQQNPFATNPFAPAAPSQAFPTGMPMGLPMGLPQYSNAPMDNQSFQPGMQNVFVPQPQMQPQVQMGFGGSFAPANPWGPLPNITSPMSPNRPAPSDVTGMLQPALLSAPPPQQQQPLIGPGAAFADRSASGTQISWGGTLEHPSNGGSAVPGTGVYKKDPTLFNDIVIAGFGGFGTASTSATAAPADTKQQQYVPMGQMLKQN